MKSNNQFHTPLNGVQQLTNNTTSWLGHRKIDKKEIAMGQTFVASNEGDLDSIEVFSNIVTSPGEVAMSLHSFDPVQQTWGPALGTTNVTFNESCNGKWVSFKIPGMHLTKGLSYGFKLESHDSYVGIGEAAGNVSHPPFASGKEWKFVNNENKGNSFSYFSLAFKVELKAA
jgi:hypothetical protein